MARSRAAGAERLSTLEARRIALAAQGFATARPSGRVDARQIRRTVDRVGLLQLDSVNVLCRSHYLPLFARLGQYPRSRLDRMVWDGPKQRALFEFWGHGASVLPLSTFPLVRWRMRAAEHWVWRGWTSTRSPGQVPPDWSSTWDPAIQAPWAVIAGMARLTVQRPRILDDVLATITARGPVTAAEASRGDRRRRATDPDPDPTTGRMWNWQDVKIAIEWLFCTGRVTTAARRGFERVYDLSERVLPAEVLAAPEPDDGDAQRELVRIAARATGIATEKQLGGYFRLPVGITRTRIAELVGAGELIETRVDGTPQRMYRWHEASAPRISARALLSPFDALIWDRDRTLRLFDFHYRISLYTPAAQRTHGYYVMPFLLGERLVARVDVKADRVRSALVVPAAHAEPGADPTVIVAALSEELPLMARWLELDRVETDGRGDLGPPLARALARS